MTLLGPSIAASERPLLNSLYAKRSGDYQSALHWSSPARNRQNALAHGSKCVWREAAGRSIVWCLTWSPCPKQPTSRNCSYERRLHLRSDPCRIAGCAEAQATIGDPVSAAKAALNDFLSVVSEPTSHRILGKSHARAFFAKPRHSPLGNFPVSLQAKRLCLCLPYFP